MTDIELYQVVLWFGRAYKIALFFYGVYLLVRNKLWFLQLFFILGASAYLAYAVLAGLGMTPPATPHRLLAVFGEAICLHVALTVVHVLMKKQSLKPLQPFSHA